MDNPRILLLPYFVTAYNGDVNYLMGVDLKHKGLKMPKTIMAPGGRKSKQEFLLPDDSVAVEILYEDVIVDGKIIEIQKTVNYLNDDDTIFVSKIENDIVRDEEALKRKRYERAYNFLKLKAKGTPIEGMVNTILLHYTLQVNLWLLGDPQPFIDSINNEADTEILKYLNVVVDVDNKTTKDALLEQLTGIKWVAQ